MTLEIFAFQISQIMLTKCGDTYSLDYGTPDNSDNHFIDIHRKEENGIFIINGVSVGNAYDAVQKYAELVSEVYGDKNFSGTDLTRAGL